MKKLLMISIAVSAIGGVVFADEKSAPKVLSDAELDNVVAGTGRDNVALQPWPVLSAAGFAPTHNGAADQGVIDKAGHLGVIVPRKP
ncbi:hypothetical protein [Ruegeria lacuscaerulensis]|uniref:hypothetical protein n=1 Tax=Ruegeria lacuscaerulensis TaxID=55218 RepID=UPI00147A079C|nr:hypothetical protein [Ruegeria lacuscaerulensis]